MIGNLSESDAARGGAVATERLLLLTLESEATPARRVIERALLGGLVVPAVAWLSLVLRTWLILWTW